jgi:hypothetical protein
MKNILFFLLPLFLLLGCSSDDSEPIPLPTTTDLITAQGWQVNNYDVQASTLGVPIPAATIAPFLDDILAQAPINGTVTFNSDNTFVVDDQGAAVNGTWSLSADESEITLVFTATSETFTFEIVTITATSFTLKFTITENVNLAGTPVPVTLEVTAFLVPTN